MKYNPSMHPVSHLAKSVLGKMEFVVSGLKHNRNELMVLNYHGTPEKFLGNFEQQLDLLEKHFEFISPSFLLQVPAITPSSKPKLLLTFDDGIRNNLSAARILEKRGIKALFFVIPGFIDCPAEEQPVYFQKNIRPVINQEVDGKKEDITAMSWKDLQELKSRGHEIGSHSYTHTMLANSSDDNRQLEIVRSKERIKEMLSVNTDFFCSPNNSLLSCGKNEMRLIKNNYRFYMSTFPGTNLPLHPFFIRRSNVEAFWLKGAFIRAIGKWDRKRWEGRMKEFESTVAAE